MDSHKQKLIKKMIACFDIGSTLIDGKSSPVRYLMKTLKLPLCVKNTLSQFLFTTRIEEPRKLAIFLNTEFNISKALAERTAIDLWDEQIKNTFTIPGAIESIQRLEAAGIPIAYISNIWRPFYIGFEREKTFKHRTFLSFKLGLSKPNPEIYQYALKAMHELPENAVMIGDTYKNDILPALSIGMKTIWILHRPVQERNDLVRVLNHDSPSPNLILAHIAELQVEHITQL